MKDSKDIQSDQESEQDLDQWKQQLEGTRKKYSVINQEIRESFIKRVLSKEVTIKDAAKEFGIKFSTSKAILQTFKKEGRIGKKKSRQRKPKLLKKTQGSLTEAQQYKILRNLEQRNTQSQAQMVKIQQLPATVQKVQRPIIDTEKATAEINANVQREIQEQLKNQLLQQQQNMLQLQNHQNQQQQHHQQQFQQSLFPQLKQEFMQMPPMYPMYDHPLQNNYSGLQFSPLMGPVSPYMSPMIQSYYMPQQYYPQQLNPFHPQQYPINNQLSMMQSPVFNQKMMGQQQQKIMTKDDFKLEGNVFNNLPSLNNTLTNNSNMLNMNSVQNNNNFFTQNNNTNNNLLNNNLAPQNIIQNIDIDQIRNRLVTSDLQEFNQNAPI